MTKKHKAATIAAMANRLANQTAHSLQTAFALPDWQTANTVMEGALRHLESYDTHDQHERPSIGIAAAAGIGACYASAATFTKFADMKRNRTSSSPAHIELKEDAGTNPEGPKPE